MMNIFKTYKIDDLKDYQLLNMIDISKLRRMVDILIIDDENVDDLIDGLRRHKFNVEYKSDIDSINDVVAHDIILCDIRGVGKKFHSSKEGAYLIKEIKNSFPSKSVIAYTASTYDATYNEYFKIADDVLSKGEDIDVWVSALDTQIKSSVDPILKWTKLRVQLLDQGMSTQILSKLESEYVKAVKGKSFDSFKKLAEKHYSNENIKNVIQELIISLLVKIITGGIS